MGFEKLITSIVTNSIRNAMRFSVSIDSLQEQFDNACPDEDKLSSIVEQKNLLNNSITQLQNSLSSLTKTNNTVSTITDSLDKAITIIKAIPIPTSVPPGVGIPTNFITGLSGTLENLKGIVKENKGLTVGFNDSINVISTSLQDMQAKINSLDRRPVVRGKPANAPAQIINAIKVTGIFLRNPPRLRMSCTSKLSEACGCA